MVGLYIATVYFGAMVSGLWAAALVKRWGPIRTSQIALCFCAAGVLLVSVPNVAVAFVGAILLGLGYGPITPSSSDILARTTPPERFALVFSIKQTGVPAGGVLAGLLVPIVLTAAGITWSLAQIAALCLVGIALGQWLRGLDAQRDRGASVVPAFAMLVQPIRFVLADNMLRRIAFCSLVFSVVQVCLSAYLVSFLNLELMWTLVAAGAALSVAQVGGVVGRIVWGMLADRWRNPRLTLLGLGVAMALAGLGASLLRPETPHFVVIALMAVFGATAIGWNGVFLGTIARLVPVESAAMVTSGCLFFTYFGVVIGPPLFGAVGSAAGRLGIAFALLSLPLAWTIWTLARAR